MLRYEIDLNVVKVTDENEKDRLLWKTLDDHKGEKVLVYVDRRDGKRSTETLCAEAKTLGYTADFFHAELTTNAKAEVIRRFKAGELTIVFATNAFGMGIDIPDIRGVIHYLLPESVEHFYQQIGRAGRDKKPAWSLLLYSDKNVDVRKRHFIGNSFPDADDMRKAFNVLSDGKVGKSTFSYFTESDDARSSYHYLLRSGSVKVLDKGFQNLSAFKVSKGKTTSAFQDLLAASKSGLVITTAKNTGQSESDIVDTVYQLLAEGKVKLEKMPAKCLIIESLSAELPDDALTQIMNDVAAKRDYRFLVLDQFVTMLDEFQGSKQLHQEIGLYLGVDKFKLGRIYKTLSGDWVRSKSEVIIANLLFERKVPFKYEQTLTVNGVAFSPDFTITWKGTTIYWEHLGLLNRERYRTDWQVKENMYREHFPNQLVTTEESPFLSRDAEAIINDRFSERIEQASTSAASLFHGYRLVRSLDSAGMSEAYVAIRQSDGQNVFLKRVRVHSSDNAALEREARIYDRLLRLQSPHVAQVLDFIRDAEYVALVTEYADGGDLHSYVMEKADGKGLLPGDAKPIAMEIAQALKWFHENGFVHRDLKPKNVLRFGELWKLSDFGIAKNTTRPVTVRTFQQRGTPGYTAPEQFEGVIARPSADVYSFGKLLVFLTTSETDVDLVTFPTWKALVKRCVYPIADERPSIEIVIKDLETIPT